MRRTFVILALAALSIVAAACFATRDRHDTTVDVSVHVSPGFAAMDDVPVVGGELRLAEPRVAMFDAAPREMIAFPLRRTNITAQVGGMMGVYVVEQIFDNPFPEPIEAVYAFPLGAHSAISGYEIVLGERTIRGEIQPAQRARDTFAQAAAAGHTAGLVEQVRANLFVQRVTNIAPGETVTVRMTVVEPLTYRDGTYELAIPTTVGPRYKPAIGVTYVPPAQSSATIGFSAVIDPGMPIVDIASPSHAITKTPTGPTSATVALASADELPNKDLIVRFTTAGAQTQVGLLAHRAPGARDGYFLLSIQPKGTYAEADITSREVMIVIDTSGSMDGEPLAQAKAVASGIIDTLAPRDRYTIITFASGVASMTPAPISGTPSNKQFGLDYLRDLRAGGGTEMAAGVSAMLDRPVGSDRVRIVYFMTDGHIGNDDVVVGAAQRLLGTNRIFTLGVGSAPNRSLLDRLAETGRGFPSYLAPREDPVATAKHVVARSAYPYLTDISVDWGGLAVDGITPTGTIPDVYAGQPIILSGRYRTPGRGTITLRARAAGRPIALPIEVALPTEHAFAPVAHLWARRQIEAATDAETIEAIGLQFQLVTPHTSFVAVDRSRVVGDGHQRVIEQPNVVPEGMAHPARETTTTSYDDGDSLGGGGSWGSWGSGGPEDDVPWIVLALAALGLAGILVIRR